MRVIILSKADYAGSGHKLCDAIRKHTDIDIDIFSGKYYNPYGHKVKKENIVSPHRVKYIQQKVNQADIIHLKGDWIPENGYLGLKILHKPVVITVSGSHFRKKEDGGHGMYDMSQYMRADVRTSFEPDLLYPEYSDIWTPHPIDSTGKGNIWRKGVPPILCHMATYPQAKDSDFARSVFEEVKKRTSVKVYIPERMSFEKAVQYRTCSTIYFDQFKVGWYGNAALEAMQYGIPVACFLSDKAIRQGDIKGCPVITTIKKAKVWAEKIVETLDSDMEKLSRQTKEWCDELHSYESVAQQWKKIYYAI